MLAALAVLVLAGAAAWLVALPRSAARSAAVSKVGSTRSPRAGSARSSPPAVGARSHSARGPSSEGTAGTFPGPDGVEARWVVRQNELPGTTAWRIEGNPPGVISGWFDRVSATDGQAVTLYVSTDASTYVVRAYRMGYYGGDGARLVWSSSELDGRLQPPCPVSPGTNMVSCDNWSPSLRVRITPAFVQGDYLFELVGSGGQESYVPLTVSDPSSHAVYLVKNDVLTWQAWNPYGGYDLYQGLGACAAGAPTYPPCNRSRVVSFDRPYGYAHGAGDFLGNEYPFVYWAEEHGLDVTYTTDVGVDQDPAVLRHHVALVSLGHDECWALDERLAVQAAAGRGMNVIFFGASPILRHVRLQASPLGPDREEVDYRDSAEDPLDGRASPDLVTGNWWGSPPTDWPAAGFVGEAYSGFLRPGAEPVPMVVSDASAWIFAGMHLQDGSEIPGALVSDFDQVAPYLHPSNLQVLAHSPIPVSESEAQYSPAYADMTYWTEPHSGAGIFDTGTVAWIPDLPRIPQIDEMTANLMRLFGSGPAGRSEPSRPNWESFAS